MSGTAGLLWLFVALAFLPALTISRWPRWFKAQLVLATTGLYFDAEVALEDVWGWLSRYALPEHSVLLAAVIEEPTKTQPGALYVWVNALEGGKPARQPRAYRLAYSQDLHGLLNGGMKKVRQGTARWVRPNPNAARVGWPGCARAATSRT